MIRFEDGSTAKYIAVNGAKLVEASARAKYFCYGMVAGAVALALIMAALQAI